MNRLLVTLLAAFDAVIAAAVGIASALAPLTVLWVFGFGATADWATLWPAAGRVWQLGHLVPLTIELPEEYATQLGVPADVATFAFSLAPLAFAMFTAVFAARSGARAARSGAWVVGVLSSGAVFAGLAALIALSSQNPIASAEFWQAVLFPAAIFIVPQLLGALITGWQVGDDGLLDDLQSALQRRGRGWLAVPGLIVRGAGISLAALVGLGALGVAAAIVISGGKVLALFQSAHVDVLGAVVLTIGQLFYLPALIGWATSFIAGPGFTLGAGTSVSPAGTQVGVVPGIPVLGAVPQETSSWLLLLALLPVLAGAFAGWVARSRFAREIPGTREPVAPRLVIAGGIAIVASGGAALLALASSGAMGPGRLADVGPEPGPVGLAVGIEVFIGAAILLLSPRSLNAAQEDRPTHSPFVEHTGPINIVEVDDFEDLEDAEVTGEADAGFSSAARPRALPPVD